MNKLKAMIIDDEPLAHEIIIDYLKEVPFIEPIHQAYNAVEALGYLNEHSVDILFLDINMPKLTGIDFLKVLNHKPQVIITSAHREYALESFDLDVCDYLLKPYRFERFLKAVNKAQQCLMNQDNKKNNSDDRTDSSIFIKVDKKLIQLKIEQISYLEAYGNYVKVWVDDLMYITPRTLISFEKELVNENGKFIRIHKSFIVQKNQISIIENKTIVMNNQQQLSIGKNYKSLIKVLKKDK